MLKKITAIFSVFIGISMISMWGMLYFTGQITELPTKPIDISFHLVNEFITAAFLILGGYGLLKDRSWARNIYYISMGMLFYSLLTVNGYYTQKSILPMTIMFSTITVTMVLLTIHSFLAKDKGI